MISGCYLLFAAVIKWYPPPPPLGMQVLGVWQCNLTVKGRVVCGTAYWDMHIKIVRVGYCFQVLDFYVKLHGSRGQK